MIGRIGLGVTVFIAFTVANVTWAQMPSYYELQRRQGVEKIPGEKIVFQSATPLTAKELVEGGGRQDKVEGYLQLPEKREGRVPAVIVFNCGDTIKAFKDLAYAEELRKQGYAVFIVNSFVNRGDSGEPGAFFRLRHAAAVDALNALKTLAADPRIDAKRIAILGWANGGVAILSAAIEELRVKYVGSDLRFAAVIPIQAWCGVGTLGKSYTPTPILMLHGERDDFLPPEHCQAYGREATQAGANLKLVLYPGADHNWDATVTLQYFGTFPSVKNCTVIGDLAAGELRLGNGQKLGFTSGDPTQVREYFRSCMTSGQYHGRHEAACARALADVKAFLAKAFSTTGN
jgi:dienelactone hydrolase